MRSPDERAHGSAAAERPVSSPTGTDDRAAAVVLGGSDWDVFISYSRKDQAFATRLHAALCAYQPPRGLSLPQRRLRAFLDTSDFAGPDYKPAIRGHLARSVKIIVICSPNAVGSRFVGPEIDDFVELHQLPATAPGSEGLARADIISVLIDGVPSNEASGPTDPRNAFPAALCVALHLPIAIDYRDFDQRRNKVQDGKYRNAWFTLLAEIYGVGRAPLEERERKRRSRIVRIRTSIAAIVAVGLLSLSAWALWERDIAIAQRNRATAGTLAAQANLLLTDPRADARLPALLAAHALAISTAPEAQRALATALGRLPPELTDDVPGILEDAAQLGELWSSPTGRYAGATAKWGVVGEIWDFSERRRIVRIRTNHPQPIVAGIRFSADERFFAIARSGENGGTFSIGELPSGRVLAEYRADSARLADAENWSVLTLDADRKHLVQRMPGAPEPIVELSTGDRPLAFALSANGRYIAVSSKAGLRLYESPSGKLLKHFDASGSLRGLAVASTGQAVAAVDDDGQARYWTIEGGGAVVGAGFQQTDLTPQGRFLIVAGSEGQVLIDLASGHRIIDERIVKDAGGVLLQLQGASDRNKIVGLHFSRDEDTLAIGRSAGDISLWQQGFVPSFGYLGMPIGLANVVTLNQGTTLYQFEASDDLARLLSSGSGYGTSPMGTMILDPVMVRIWETRERAEVARIVGNLGPSGLSRDGTTVLTTESWPGKVWNQRTFHLKRWRLPRAAQPEISPLTTLVGASADGSVLLLAMMPGNDIVLKTADGVRRVGPLFPKEGTTENSQAPPGRPVNEVAKGATSKAASLEGAKPAATAEQEPVSAKAEDRETAHPLGPEQETAKEAAAVDSSDGNSASFRDPSPAQSTIDEDNSARAEEAPTGEEASPATASAAKASLLAPAGGRLGSVGVTADGTQLYRTSEKSFELLPIAGGNASVVTFERRPFALALSRGGRVLAATSLTQDGAARASQGDWRGIVTDVWQLPDGVKLGSFAHPTPGGALAISDDGQYLVTATLEAASGRAGRDPDPAAMMLGGRMVADLWDWRAARLIATRKGGAGPGFGRSPGFSTDGRYVAFDTGAGTVRIVSTGDGTETAEIPVSASGPLDIAANQTLRGAAPLSIAFNADGTRLLVPTLEVSMTRKPLTIQSVPWRTDDLVALMCARIPADARALDEEEQRRYLPTRSDGAPCAASRR